MSAPEDKISSNRRRLFKALSAAPVVMTLKPGAALANSSAFQCVQNIIDGDPALEAYGPEPAPTPGFVTDVHDYFNWPPDPLPDQWDDCVLKDLAADFVAYIDGSLYSDKNPGSPIDPSTYIYASGAGDEAGKLTLLNKDQVACGSPITGTKGRFAKLGGLDPNDSDFTGESFPKANPEAPGMYGITGTCMASFYGVPPSQAHGLNHP